MTSEEFRNDPMFLRNQFASDGVFEIPMIQKDEISLEKTELIGYDRLNENETKRIVHFFLDDYKFEVMWNDPEPRAERLKRYKAVLSPNYSLYSEMPVSLKVFNTFRSRWCGAYLQSKGIKVIPTVSWGEPNTFWFCFDGIPKGSVVAVSTLGVRTEKALFMQGYDEMLRKIKPEAVICYGKPFAEMKGKIIEIDYAQTNNLSKTDKNLEQVFTNKNIFSIVENVASFEEKGMGSAGSGGASLPKNNSQIRHIFRKKTGHIEDTPENRSLLERVGNCKDNYVGSDKYGNQWYSEIQSDGSQVWVQVRDGTIQNGGVNDPPLNWNVGTGYSNPKGEFIYE